MAPHSIVEVEKTCYIIDSILPNHGREAGFLWEPVRQPVRFHGYSFLFSSS